MGIKQIVQDVQETPQYFHEVYLYTAIASGVLMVPILSFWVVAKDLYFYQAKRLHGFCSSFQALLEKYLAVLFIWH